MDVNSGGLHWRCMQCTNHEYALLDVLQHSSKYVVDICSQVFPIGGTSFDLLSTFFITLTVSTLLINMSNASLCLLIFVFVIFFVRKHGRCEQQVVHNIRALVSWNPPPCKVQNWAKWQWGVDGFKTGQMVRICGRLRSVPSPTFPWTARACVAALQLYSLALFSTLDRRLLVSGAGKCCQRADVSPSLTRDFWPVDGFPTSWSSSRLWLELGPEVSCRLHFRPFYNGRDTWLELSAFNQKAFRITHREFKVSKHMPLSNLHLLRSRSMHFCCHIQRLSRVSRWPCHWIQNTMSACTTKGQS